MASVVEAAGRRRSPGRDPLPRRRRLRRRQLARRGPEGRHPRAGDDNGYGERCGNANLVSIIPNLQLKLGYECLTSEQLAALTPDRALPRRAAELHAGPGSAVRRPQRVRPQGRDARRRRRRRSGHVRARRPGGRRQPARRADLRALGQGHRSCPGRARPGSSSTTPPPARVIERVKEREHRGYHYEAADGSFELLLRKETGEYEPLFRLESWRAIVEKRADGRVETEATIKIWVDGERYVRTAEGNGPVNALDRALRDALVEIHPHLARHRPRQLQGPDPGRDEGHRRDHPRAARRLRRRSRCGARSASRRT